MLSEAGSQHVREQSRHDGRAQHIIKSLQAFAFQKLVDVKKEIVHILQRQMEIVQAKVVWQS